MNFGLKKSVLAGLVLGTVIGHADVVIDDFTGGTVQNLLKNGGDWTPDSDVYSGGSSDVKSTDGTGIVKPSGSQALAYDTDDTTITSNLYVKADVSATQKWAYAGWVMDFFQPKPPADSSKHVWDLQPWERQNEADISTCTSLDITLNFEKDRVLWIDLFMGAITKASDGSPQNGWHYTGKGVMETKSFKLTGITGPAQKWAELPPKVKFDLKQINRIRFIYEGVKSPVATPTYDTLAHTLKIHKINMVGGNCQVVPAGSTIGIIPQHVAAKSAIGFVAANGQIRFGSLSQIGDLKVTVRDMSGKVMVKGLVNGLRPSLDVSGLKNGVYSVQAENAKLSVSNTITLLN